jgi:hypothetical protein
VVVASLLAWQHGWARGFAVVAVRAGGHHTTGKGVGSPDLVEFVRHVHKYRDHLADLIPRQPHIEDGASGASIRTMPVGSSVVSVDARPEQVAEDVHVAVADARPLQPNPVPPVQRLMHGMKRGS